MNENEMSREQLVKEIKSQKRQIGELKRSEIECKQILDDLQKSEEQYRDLVEKGNIAIAIDDIQGNTLYFNNQFLDLYGYSAKEMKTNSHKILTHPDDLELVTKYHNNRLLGKKVPSRYEFRGLRKDGATVYIEIDVCEIVKENGKISGTRSYFWDITKRKKAEEALLQEKDFYHSFVESIGDWVWEIDMHGIHTYSNKAIEDILGYKVKEVVGFSTTKLWSDKQRSRSEKNLKKDLGSGKGWNNYIAYFCHKDGSVRILESTAIPIYNPENELVGYRGIDHDITNRMHSQQKIRESEEKYRTIFESKGTATLIIDMNTSILQANKECENVTGYSTSELVGKSWTEFVFKEDLLIMLRRSKERAKDPESVPDKYEVRLVNSKGEIRNTILSIGMIPDSKTSIVSMLDITERKQAEKDLAESENKFRGLFENSSEFLFTLDLKGNFTDVNRSAVVLTGHTRAELLKKNFKDYIPKSYHRKLFHTLNKSYKTGKPVNDLFIEAKMKDNSVRYFIVGLNLIKEGDEIIGFQGTSTDITERKQAEETIQQNTMLLRNSQRLAKIGSWSLDLISDKASWSKEIQKIYGRNPKDNVPSAEDWKDTIHKDDWEKLELHIRQVKLGEKDYNIEFRIKRNDNGEIRYIHSLGEIILENNIPVKLIGVDQDITERKCAEEERRKSEMRVLSFFENAIMGMYSTTVQGDILSANPALLKMLGYSSLEELKTRNLGEEGYEPGYERSNFKKKIEKNGKVVGLESAWPRKDGSIVFIRENAIAKKDDENNILYYEGTVEDITERKQIEIVLKDSEAKLRATFAAMTDIIIVYDSEGHYLEIAPTVPSNLFLPKQDMIGKNVTELFPSEKADFFLQNIQHTLKTKQLSSLEYSLRIDEQDIWFSALVSPLSDNSVVWVARDITERKQSEEELTKLSTAVNQSPSVIVITDIKGNLEYVNPKFTELTGYTLDDVKGLNPRFLKSGKLQDETYKKMWKTISAGKEWRGEFQNIKKNGTLFWEGASISPIFDKSKRIINFLKVAKDITEQKQAEKIQRTIFNISNALNSAITLNDLYAEIRIMLTEIIDTTNLYIALYDKETDFLSLPFNIDEKDNFESFPAGKTITKYVIDTGKPLFATKDIVKELTKKGLIENVGSPSEIWVGVPLKIGNEVIGVIAVQSYDDPKLYTEKDLELLTFVSEEIALAINHKRSEEQIKRNLAEKNTLLKELYHRTKNNMQVISSMLRIQSHRSDDEFVHESFEEIVHKIQAMALVHQKLYEADDLSYINLKEYIEEILESLMQSYNISTDLFSYNLDLKNVYVTIDSATPLGLVLNELISNVFKHSFPNNRKGNLSIKLAQKKNGDINLQLTDNGVGLPSGLNPEKTESMGLQTVYSLIVYQLQGSVNYEDKDGLSWFIKFSDTKTKLRV